MTLTGRFRKPFDEQVTAFRLRLQQLVPTAKWDDLWQAQHDRAFMVAGATKADLLADLAAAVDRAVTEGTSLEQFRQDFRGIVEKRGWHGWTGEGTKRGEAWRTRVIYRTNLSTTYASGRWAQLMDAKFPLLVYRHGGSRDPRIEHLGWDGLILPADHPFWATHAPPNGWGCSCFVLGARSEAGAVRLGGKPGKTLSSDWRAVSPQTGAPVGIDKGWAYAPGASLQDLIAKLADKLPKLPAPTGASLVAKWPSRIFGAWSEAFGGMIDEIEADRMSRKGRWMIVGSLHQEWVSALGSRGLAPRSAEIAIREDDIRHMFRPSKGQQIDMQWFRRLPEHLRQPDAVYLDQTRDPPALLLVFGKAPANKLVIQIDFTLRNARRTVNVVNTGKVVLDVAGMAGPKVVQIWPDARRGVGLEPTST